MNKLPFMIIDAIHCQREMMEKYRDDPEYCEVLRTVLKSQIKQLVEQLSFYGGEEAVLLSASISDGTLSHIGSKSGQQFLNVHSHVKSLFLGFCLKGAKETGVLPMSPLSIPIETGKRAEPASRNTLRPPAKKQKVYISDNPESEETLLNIQREYQAMMKMPAIVIDPSRSHTDPSSSSSHTVSSSASSSSSGANSAANTSRSSETSKDKDNGDYDGATPGHSKAIAGHSRDKSKSDVDSFIEMECVDDTASYSDSVGIFSSDIVKETLADIKQEPESDVDVDEESNEPTNLSTNVFPPESSESYMGHTSSDHSMGNTSQVKEEMTSVEDFRWEEFKPDDVNWVEGKSCDSVSPRNKRKVIFRTIKTKYEALLQVEAGKKRKSAIARDFNIPNSTLNTWTKYADQIKDAFLHKGHGYSKRFQKGAFS